MTDPMSSNTNPPEEPEPAAKRLKKMTDPMSSNTNPPEDEPSKSDCGA